MRIVRTLTLPVLALASVGMVMLMGLAGTGCYPKNCDPKTDTLKCKCPQGPCGDPPSAGGDAGKEGGK